MNVDLGIWEKLTRAVIVLLLLAFVLGVVVWYLPLIRQNEAMRKEILRLESKIKQEEEKARQNDVALRALRSDPKTIERTARQKLGYARPSETIIVFEPASTNHAAATR